MCTHRKNPGIFRVSLFLESFPSVLVLSVGIKASDRRMWENKNCLSVKHITFRGKRGAHRENTLLSSSLLPWSRNFNLKSSVLCVCQPRELKSLWEPNGRCRIRQ